MMSNKPHLRPHQKQQASRTTRLLVAILILGIFALAIALEVTGHVEFRGRLILLRASGTLSQNTPVVAVDHRGLRVSFGHGTVTSLRQAGYQCAPGALAVCPHHRCGM
jgi:hypothetical protein